MLCGGELGEVFASEFGGHISLVGTPRRVRQRRCQPSRGEQSAQVILQESLAMPDADVRLDLRGLARSGTKPEDLSGDLSLRDEKASRVSEIVSKLLR